MQIPYLIWLSRSMKTWNFMTKIWQKLRKKYPQILLVHHHCSVLYQSLVPNQKWRAIDQLFTFLTWLRLGFTLGLTAWLFNMPKLTISRYLITWSNFLYLNLGCIPAWHPKMNVLHQCHNYLKRHTLVLESLLYRVVLPKTFKFNNTK